MTEEVMGQIEWLYNPHAKPAKELSKHDQQMIQLGWDAHKTLRLDGPDREKMEGLLSQYSSELLAWKSWGIDAVAKTHDLKVQIAGEILALIPDIEKLKRHYELQEGYVVMAAIEEAKKQERERIIEKIRGKMFLIDKITYTEVMGIYLQDWQALQLEEG